MLRRVQYAVIAGTLAIILTACAGESSGKLEKKSDVFADCPGSPNCISSRATDDGHYISPLVFTGDPETAFARLRTILANRNDTKIIDEEPDYLRVEFRTTFFIDDGEFLLDKKHRMIQVRSASRIGYWDLGKNRHRMEEIRRAFQQCPQ